MLQELKCVIVNDEKFVVESLSGLCRNIPNVKISNSFDNHIKFLEALPGLEFDVCLLDICMPGADGLFVAEQIKSRQVIFVTGNDDIRRRALDISHLDVINKPIKIDRLNDAFQKARKMMSTKTTGGEVKECHPFNMEGEKGKVKLKLSDILFIQSDIQDSRNKNLFMRNNRKYTVIDYTFESLLHLCPNIVKINKSEMLSLDIVQKYNQDTISLEGFAVNGKTTQVTLSRNCRKEFIKRISSW
jgi:DNA-binding LytR/AlgR family response regulator